MDELRPGTRRGFKVPAQISFTVASAAAAAYPTLIASAYVLTAGTDAALRLGDLWRSVAAAVVLVIMCQLLFVGVFREFRFASLCTLLFVGWLAGAHTAALVAFDVVLIGVLVERFRNLRGQQRLRLLDTTTRWLRAFGPALIIVVGVTVVAPGQAQLAPPLADMTGQPAEPGSPDIYLILLDGYPRADTLEKTYGFSNAPFLEALQEQGFKVAANSRSNYNLTLLTMVSMFAMEHIPDIEGLAPTGNAADQQRRLYAALHEPVALSILRDAGYRAQSISLPAGQPALQGPEELIEGGLNTFEMEQLAAVARFPALTDLLVDYLADQHRDRVRASLAALRRAAEATGPQPSFVYAHIMLPHTPFLFGPNGEERSLPACFPHDCQFFSSWEKWLALPDFRGAATDQIQFLNGQILGIVQRILASAETPPIIILLSDHGTRYDQDDRDEMMQNLFAAYTPGHPDLFGEDATPIAVFPRLLNAYLGKRIQEPAPLEFQWDMKRQPGPLEIEPFDRPGV